MIKKMGFMLLILSLTGFSASSIKEVKVIENPEIEEYILIDGSVPEIVKAENPSTPVVMKRGGFKGGIDSGAIGDENYFYLASARDKRWHGGTVNPEAISISFKIPGETEKIEIEIGYFAGGSLTRQFDIFFDETRIHSAKLPAGTYGSTENILKDIKLQLILQKESVDYKTHKIRIYQADWWGCTLIDAIKIRGKGIKLLTPDMVECSQKELEEIAKKKLPHLPSDFYLPEGCIGIDFGTEDSVVWQEKGFIKITEKDKYREDKIAGWIDNKNLVRSRDNSAGGDILRKDYVFGSFENVDDVEFRIKVKPGTYYLFFISGGIRKTEKKAFRIKVEDKEIYFFQFGRIMDMVLNRPAMFHQTIKVKVEDGEINMSFPEGYFCLNGLIVYPEGKKEEMERQINKLIESYYLPSCVEVKEYKTEPKKETGKLEDVIDEPILEPKKDYSQKIDISKEEPDIFIHPYIKLIYPDTLPDREEIKDKIEIFATPGEYEPVVFSIRTYKKSLSDVKIDITPLKGKRGEIGIENFDIRYVEYIKQSVTTRPNGQYRISPKILFPFKGENLPSNFTRTYWLTLKIPEKTAPDVYKGKIIVKGKGYLKELELQLEVMPYKIEKLKDRYIGFYWNPYGWSISGEKNLEKQIKDMAEHGVNATTAYGDGIKIFLEDGRLKIDFSKKEKIMELKKKYGITGPIPDTIASGGNITSLGFKYGSKEFEEYYKEMIRILFEKHKQENWPEIIFYPMDEPRVETMVEQGSYLCKLIKSIPGTTTYITNTAENFYAAKTKAPDIDNWLDIFCFSRYSKKEIDEIKGKGKRFFFYSGIYSNPLTVRYISGFYFYFTDTEALYYWVYNWQKCNPYFDLDGDERETGAVICSEEGDIIPTIWWESLREGVDDLKYLIALKEKLEKCKDEELKEKGKGLIEEIEGFCEIGTDKLGETVKQLNTNPEKLNNFRKEIAYLLKEIVKKEIEK